MVAEGPQTFGALLRQHRLRAGLTQEALAERAALTPRGLIHLERGTRRPYPDTLHRLAEALHLTDEERAILADAARPVDALRGTPLAASTPPKVLIADTPPPVIPTTPLVGRDRELAVLRDRLEAARAGRGGLVLISGEAGIGKTALAEALCWDAEQRGVRVLVGPCYDLSETPPFWPWTEALRQFPPSPAQPPFPAASQTVAATPQQFFVEVRDFFAASTANAPLVLLLDDLQWADPVSLDLLRFLARSLATLPMLVLATHRDDLTRHQPLSQLLPLIARESHATRVDLPPLSAEALRDLGRDRFHLEPADEERLVSYLMERTDGNALFATELLRTLEEHNIIAPGGGALGDLEVVGVPALLKQVVEERVTRLGEEAERLLGIAAVIGTEVPLDLWAQVAERDEERIDEIAEQGLSARLLREIRHGAGVAFTHTLIRAAIYEGIPGPRRRRMHRTIAEVVAGGNYADPDAVAYHFRMASDARAVEWLVRAGRRAYRSFAWLSAAERYETAIALMTNQGKEGSVDQAWLRVDRALLRVYVEPQQGIADLTAIEAEGQTRHDALLHAIIQASRGRIRCLTGDYGGLDDLAAGVTGLDTLSEADRARAAHLGDVIDRFVIAISKGIMAFFLALVGRFDEAQAMAQRALADAHTNNGPDLNAANADLALIRVYGALGQPDEAQRTFVKAREALKQLGQPMFLIAAHSNAFDWIVYQYTTDDLVGRGSLMQAVDRIFAQSVPGMVEHFPNISYIPLRFLVGEWEDVRRLALAQHSPSDVRIYMVRCLVGMIARAQGNPAEAWDRVHDVLPAGPLRSPGNIEFFAALETHRLAVMLALDAQDLVTARSWLDAYDDLLEWSHCIPGRSGSQTLWAQYERVAGRPGQAMIHAQAALDIAMTPRQPRALQAAHLILGELACDSDRYTDAERHLPAALALAEACAAPYERACTLLALAEMQRGMGHREEALQSVREAKEISRSLSAVPMLARANTLEQRLATV